jgi:hypothetical protein
MAHLTPEQFVDIADGVLAEAGYDVAPHLAACVECRQQVAGMRAMMAEAAGIDVVELPEPSPLFWEQLSARVRDAVAEEPDPRSWHDRLLRPFVLVPSLAGALVAVLFVMLLTRPALAPLPLPPPPTMSTATVTPPPDGADRASVPVLEPSLPPLGAADDPQLGLVADYGTTLDWDEMADEIAQGRPGTSSDALLGALTVEEQRELQRLIADEMAQPAASENRS